MFVFFAKYRFFFVFMTALSVVIISMIYVILKPVRKLPVYAPEQVSAVLVDSSKQEVRTYHRIADFSLQNQDGRIVTQQDYYNKVYVADFFFTSCQTICPVMTGHMRVLQEKLSAEPDVLLLSHTVMPETDQVPQLQKYALENGVNPCKWNLVTGSKRQLYDLARKSYLVAKSQETTDSYALIHTENFALIDRQRRIRGFYDGTDPQSIAKLLEDIELLMKE